MGALLANLGVAIGILVIGISLLLTVVGFVSWLRIGHGRLLWVGIAFALLAIQGALITWGAYQDRAQATFPLLPIVALATVLALYAAVLKR